MSFFATAEEGLACLNSMPLPGQRSLVGPLRPVSVGQMNVNANTASTGYAWPVATYEKMREMQAFASSLNLLIDQNANDAVFRANWGSWYNQTWLPYYLRYAGPDASLYTKFGVAAFMSDAVAEQVESFRRTLVEFDNQYRLLKQPNGQPVPQPPTRAPEYVPPSEIQTPTIASILPWWGWMLAGIGIVGAGYFAYRYYLAPVRAASRLVGHDADRSADHDASPKKRPGDLLDLETYAELGDHA